MCDAQLKCSNTLCIWDSKNEQITLSVLWLINVKHLLLMPLKWPSSGRFFTTDCIM
jgi:hypothetical protein